MEVNNETVTLTLGRSEALTLFELLADFYEDTCLPISNEAERLSLVRLHGALEKALIEPFASNYKELIEKARTHLIAESGSR